MGTIELEQEQERTMVNMGNKRQRFALMNLFDARTPAMFRLGGRSVRF